MRVWIRAIALGCAAAGLAACGKPRESAPARPSVLLVVMDTTRMDAVSAYGEQEGTTPYLDSLAGSGLLYRWALAPAPWTLPSHATLFTSLGPERHGVGVDGRMALASGFETLASRMREAGYETIGFAENPLVMSGTGLDAGFEHFEGEQTANLLRIEDSELRFDVVLAVRRWLESRRADRPFLLFVNLFDPHDPYELREHTELPPGVDRLAASSLGRGTPGQGVAEFAGICDHLPSPFDLSVLRSLYLGEVQRADAKLRQIREQLVASTGGPLLTVVTSDHGEHLGEHRLLGHEFSVRGEVLRVPLVVHGLADVPPGEIGARVGLRDIAPSIAHWVGVEPPDAWTGRRLPTSAGTEGDGPPEEPARPMRAFYDDTPLTAPRGYQADGEEKQRRRLGCGPEDRVFGDLLSVVRFPFKLISYAEGEPELYDLRWDRGEQSDVARFHPEQVEELHRELLRWRHELDGAAREGVAEPAGPETLEALKALGYVE